MLIAYTCLYYKINVQGDDDDDDDNADNPNIKPSPAADDQGGTSKARKKTDAVSSKMVKKARAG